MSYARKAVGSVKSLPQGATSRLPVPVILNAIALRPPNGSAGSPTPHGRKAIEAGAGGFVVKTDPSKEIITKSIKACRGEPQFNAVSTRQLIHSLFDSRPMIRRNQAKGHVELVERAQTSARLPAAEDTANAAIAKTMSIKRSPLLSAAYDSLDLSRVQLARLVERTDLDDLRIILPKKS